ncbi:MAG: exosortase system-associated protein, TIGR04073 family [Candidatus Omnitrophica bacterium]|nr:exosortase system-associated protein, TIGR04073 family [Candidatus Omnitrophota bacterium]
MKFKRLAAAVLFLLLFQWGSAWAIEFKSEPPAPPDSRDLIGRKLGRGFANLFFGWLEIPKAIEKVTYESNFIAGMTAGTLQGAGKTVVRTLAGALEILTFPMPNKPLIEPEFVLDKPGQDQS